MVSNNTISKLTEDYYPDEKNSIYDDLFKQYNRVVIESLLTSFGLDMLLVKDQYGGDVDTIHNVEKIGEYTHSWNNGKIQIKNEKYDPLMKYKSLRNEENYKNREEYNSKSYHKHENYIAINRENSKLKKEGMLYDGYTGEKIKANGKTNLDHIISAKEISEDRVRILAGLKGEDLANSPENLIITNESLNKSKSAYSMNEFLNREKNREEKRYSEDSIKRMENLDKRARKAYKTKLNIAYYTSSNFRKDLLTSSANVGVRMGLRQAVGFLLTEVVFTVMDEFKKLKTEKLDEIFAAISNGIKKGFENAKLKYKELISKFKDGVIAGIIGSLTTTLTNIFFTTSKNIIRVIRQSWVSLVEALKIVLFNPDNLPFGERMRAVAKIFATTASVIVSIVVREVLTKIGIAAIPVVGDVLVTFIEILSMGLTSCTLLYFLDRSEMVNKAVNFLNNLPTISNALYYYKEQAKYFEQYAAQILSIDVENFEREVEKFNSIANKLENAKDENELNSILVGFYKEMKIKLPWQGDFDSFMKDKNSVLIFE
jgi:hypothetical protein